LRANSLKVTPTAPMALPASLSAKLQSLLQNGIVHHRAGRLADADLLYRQARAIAPAHFDLLHWSGRLAYQQGKFAEAVDFLGRAHALDPANAVCEMRLGLALLVTQRLSEAEVHLRFAAESRPDFHEAWDALAHCFRAQQRLREALECHEKALAIAPGYAPGWYNRGLTLTVAGCMAEANICFARALAANPNYTPARDARAATHPQAA
jgi:protein O-GlcNAc transferase